MRQLKKVCLLIICLMVFGLAMSTMSHQTRADDATPIAEEPATATPVPTSAPTDVATAVPTPVPTEAATAAPTDAATMTTTPSATATSVPSATATKAATTSAVKAQSVSNGSLKVAMVDANRHPRSQSCLEYASFSGENIDTLNVATTLICDGVPAYHGTAADDGHADGYVTIADLAPGRWLIESDPSNGVTPAPLPMVLTVQAAKTTSATMTFGTYGSLDVRNHDANGDLLHPCADLMLDWPSVGGDQQPDGGAGSTKIASQCDVDDGSYDGVVHFAQLAVGTYWVEAGGSYGLVTIKTGQTASFTSEIGGFSVNINVVDAATTAPVGLMDVAVYQVVDATHQPRVSLDTTSGTSSPVRLTLTPGTYFIRVYPDTRFHPPAPYNAVEVDGLVVKSTDNPRTITIAVSKIGTPPSMSLSATSAFVGDRDTVTVQNMPAQSTVTIKIDGRKVGSGTTGAVTNLSVGVTIPALTEGVHTVTASSGAVSLSKTLTIKASQTVSATTVAAGKTVKITVHGFRAKETVTIRIYGLNSTTKYLVLGTLTVDGSGSGSKTVTIPSTMSAGSHKLVSYGKDTHAGNYVTVTVVRHEAPAAARFAAGLSAWRRI